MRHNQKKRRATYSNGSVLVLVMVIVLVGFIIGTGLMSLGTQGRTTAIYHVRDMHARAAADAGLESAIQRINATIEDKTWSAATVPTATAIPLALTESSYSYKSTYDGTDGHEYEIVSVGTNQRRSRTVRAQLRLKGLFDSAIQCRNSLILKSGTVIDTYDSRISMNPADCSEPAMIGTNSTNPDSIILNNTVIVDGDVVVGTGGDTDTVVKDLGAIVDSMYPMPVEAEFPTITPPSLIGPDTTIKFKTGEMTLGAGGDYPATGRFQGIDMGQGSVLRVIDNCTLYLTGDVKMDQSCEIIVDVSKNASLTIYIDGDWISANNSGVNNETQQPTSFRLYGTGPLGQKIDLKAKSDFYGVIYAPDADMTVFSGGNIYGAFVSNNFEMKNPAAFLYDVALGSVSIWDEGVRFIISRWDEL